MKKMVSKILMSMAALIMLLMSAVPHHHHCGNFATAHHIDYICFDDSGCFDCQTDCCGSDHHHCRNGTENCRIHSLVTLLSRVQNVPSGHLALEYVVPQEILPETPVEVKSKGHQIRVPDKLSYQYRVRTKGLRAPPVV